MHHAMYNQSVYKWLVNSVSVRKSRRADIHGYVRALQWLGLMSFSIIEKGATMDAAEEFVFLIFR